MRTFEPTEEWVAAHQAKVKAGRKGVPAVNSVQVLTPPEKTPAPVLTLRPRANPSMIGVAARGVMNKTEARYASEVLELGKLEGEIKEYWYESVKLKLADGAWFTVDFFVLLSNGILECHEVKGFWRESARVRIKVAAERYPFRFVSASRIKKKAGGGWAMEAFG